MESSEHTEPTEQGEPQKKAPTYVEDHEVRAARAAYGSSYDKLIASGAIIAPTRADLSDDELADRLKADDEKRTAETAAKRK